MRNANARMAVLQKLKPQAASDTPMAGAPLKRPAQQTIQEMYARHALVSNMES